MKRTICIILVYSLFCIKQTTLAQLFPVQATINLKTPYPIYLPEYADATGDRLSMKVLLRDLKLGPTQVYFNFRISGNSVSFSNRPILTNKPTFLLQPGVSRTFTQGELASYFSAENLLVSPAQYTAQLPEGMYTFSVEVIDVQTNKPISILEQAPPVWLFVNDPPILVSPANKINEKVTNPQNVIFQWTPRHRQALTVEYEFTLTEIIEPNGFNGNPQNFFLAQPAYFKTRTPNTTLIYNPGYPPLVEGRLYAFRVQALARQGVSNVGVFRNNGYSEIFTFRYGEQNIAPKMLSAKWGNDGLIELTWESRPMHVRFDMRTSVYDPKNKAYIQSAVIPIFRNNLGQVVKNGLTYSMKMAGNFASQYSFNVGGISAEVSDRMLYSNSIELIPFFGELNIASIKKDLNDYVFSISGKSRKKNPNPLVSTCTNPNVSPTDMTSNSIVKGDILYAGGSEVEVIDNETAKVIIKVAGVQTPITLKMFYSPDFKINQYNEVIAGYLSSTPTNHRITLINSNINQSGDNNALPTEIIKMGFEIDSLKILANNSFDKTSDLIQTSFRNSTLTSEIQKGIGQLKLFLVQKQSEIQKTIGQLDTLEGKSGNTSEQIASIRSLKNQLSTQQSENQTNITTIENFEKTYTGVSATTYSRLTKALFGIK